MGHPDFQDHITLGGLLLPIRRTFDQYVCERPSVLYDGINSPIKGYEAGDIDMVVVRENTEGEYADVGGFVYLDFPEELGIQSRCVHSERLREDNSTRVRGRPEEEQGKTRYIHH